MNNPSTVEIKFDEGLSNSYRKLVYVLAGLSAISVLMHIFM